MVLYNIVLSELSQCSNHYDSRIDSEKDLTKQNKPLNDINIAIGF